MAGHDSGAVAQLVAHHTGSVGVRGSSPLSSTRLTRAFTFRVRALVGFGCSFGCSFLVASLPLLLPLGTALRLAEQRRTHLVGGLLGQRRQDVAVDVGRGAHLRVPEQLHHDPGVNAFGEQQGGGRVPAVVQPDMADSRCAQQQRPLAVVVAVVDRSAKLVRENQS